MLSFLEDAMSVAILPVSPFSVKTGPKFLLSLPQGRENLHIPPRQRAFENRFPTTVERGKGSYDLLYQNLLGKDEHNYGH